MSFTVPGSTWTPKSAYQHAETVLSAINTALAPLSISVVPILGNVIWLFCLGIGSVVALFDESLTSAKNSFNPSLCDDDQVLHLLPITGLERLEGTYSSLNVDFTATVDGALTVPAGTHLTIVNQTYLFLVATTTVVPAGDTVSIACICDTIGPVQVSIGQVASVVETLVNLDSANNSEVAVVGRDLETVSSLRTRILSGLVTYNNLEGLTIALRSLTGINQAKVWFNESATTPLVLPGSITVPVRSLYIVVNGSSDEIAETWAARSMAPTYGASSQDYTTLSGQLLTMNYDVSVSEDIYVTIYVSSLYERQSGYEVMVQDAIIALQQESEIGAMITSEFILSALDDFLYAVVTGAEVSLDGIAYGRTAAISAKSLPSFTIANISIVEEP